MHKTILCLIAFTAIFIVVLVLVYWQQSAKDEILSNPVFVLGEIESVRKVERFKRGRKIANLLVSYNFVAGDEKYVDSIETHEPDSRYEVGSKIEIAYLKSNPTKSIPQQRLGNKLDFLGYVKLVGKAFIFSLFVMLVIIVFIIRFFGSKF